MATKKDTTKAVEATEKAPDPEPAATANAKVQKAFDVETEQGFRGVEVDPTDNAAYTVAGVTAGAPTPETSLAAADAARDHQREIRRPGDGPGQE
jgi:hypothetical protein